MNLYSAFIVVPYTQGAQVRITQCYLQIIPYLPLRLQKSYGLGGQVLNWFASYLCGRVQHVRTSAACSTPSAVLYEVPQESVLWPMLFLLYTADLLQLVKRHQLIHRAYTRTTLRSTGFADPQILPTSATKCPSLCR